MNAGVRSADTIQRAVRGSYTELYETKTLRRGLGARREKGREWQESIPFAHTGCSRRYKGAARILAFT